MNAGTSGADQTGADHSSPWTLWLNLCHVIHAWQVEWCHIWGRHCLPSFYPSHPHEGHLQLELPEPLAESAEPELFA